MQLPSQRISEVDPRGGAAVVGANGVGKTTTLRLVPLFFGHLASQIVHQGHGQTAMVRFILPTYESALVFEYQRGSSEVHDVRLAVLRARKDNPDAAEYRIFQSGYHRDLFVGADGTFLDDENSIAAARELGVNVTPKLSPSDYRAVILNLRATNKDALKLRSYAREHSFGPKAMPNLDRLVAAVVKDHVNFSDLVQVAVGMVNEEIGANGAGDRNKVLLKQTKSEIKEWVSNRRACQDAANLEPKVAALREAIQRFFREEREIHLLRAEVRGLLADKTIQLSNATNEKESVERAREEAATSEKETHDRLDRSRIAAEGEVRTANSRFGEQEATKKEFDSRKAEMWAEKRSQVPHLNAERQTITSEQALYEAQFSSAKSAIDSEINAARERLRNAAQAELEAVDVDRAEAESRYGIASQNLEAEKASARDSARERHDGRRAELGAEVNALQIEFARVGGLAERVEGPPELREVVENAREELTGWAEKLDAARMRESAAFARKSTALTEYDRIERDLETARGSLGHAVAEVASLERSLAPEEGTLLSALRGQPSENWVALAKVIGHEHLSRIDLAPSFDAEKNDFTIYGWSLDLEKIGLPSWVDEERTRNLLLKAKQKQLSARNQCDEIEEKLKQASSRHSDAKTKLDEAQGDVTLVERNKTTTGYALERAKGALDEARRSERAMLDTELKRLSGAILAKDASRASHEKSAAVESRTIVEQFDKRISELAAKRKAEIQAFNDKRSVIKSNLTKHEQALEAQRHARLREANLDPLKIETWEKRKKEIDDELEFIQTNTPLINQWINWINADGPATLVRLRNDLDLANTVLSAVSRDFQDHQITCRQREEAYKTQESALGKRIANLDEQCSKLRALAEDFRGYDSAEKVSFDPDMTAIEMKGKVDAAFRKLDRIESETNELYQHVYNRLTGRDNDVKRFIEASLSDLSTTDRISMARGLVNSYDRIPREVVANLNNTLRAILDTIERFHGSILGFETEIKRFNNRLKLGLASVTQFERIKNLQIELVTDFSDLGFMDRLKDVSQVVANKDYTQGRPSNRTQVPGDDADVALEDFANVIGGNGRIEVDLASHVRLHGRVSENGVEKIFRRESELENISSTGLTSVILITLLIGMLNMIRGKEDVYVAWVTDEVGKFDGPNFMSLMDMLHDNRIDVITASPDLNPRHFRKFSQRYRFEDRGVIRMFVPPSAARENSAPTGLPVTTEASL
ncbi:ATP-binding protein [Paraburkholderia sp.]|uniref:ATP-binding protein n=1 Tax=Paraburkholderia sp. TaxID=1926495 RepID=UPI003C7C13FD